MTATQRILSVPVRTLLREVEDGQYAVPKLQRAFVWNGEKAAVLLDSILRGLPVGVITVWNARKANSHQLPNTLHILPQPKRGASTVKFILDGQQRLSVLHHLRHGDTRRNARRQEVDFGRVLLRLRPKAGDKLVEYRKPTGDYVPVYDLLRDGWKAHTAHLKSRDLAYAKMIRERILSYRMAVTVFEGQALEEARELFIRINSSGTPLASADKAFARAQRIDLRAKVTGLREQLQQGFAGISNETILQTLAFASGSADVGARAQEQVVKEWERRAEVEGGLRDFDRTWKAVSDAVQLALDALKYFGVRSDAILPSQYMVATLAQYFCERKTLTPHCRKELRTWFWATALGQRYSGRGFNTNVAADASVFRKLGQGKSVRFPAYDRIPASDIRRASYSARSSISDAFTLLLSRRKPKDLLDGHEFPMADLLSATSKTHRHHFFPRAFLKRHGVSVREQNSILNLCLVKAGTNSKVGSRSPWTYLDDVQYQAFYGSMLVRSLLPDIFGLALDRWHVASAYRGFLNERMVLVADAFESEAGRRLFARDF